MGCYQPLIRKESKTVFLTAKDGHKYGKPEIIKTHSLDEAANEIRKYRRDYKTQMIPCGKCIGCRLDYSRAWADRGYLHTLTNDNNWFVTLTYNNEHLTTPEIMLSEETGEIFEPDHEGWKGILIPNDVKKFMHNLRQIMERDYHHKGIDFMAAGEYGGLGRPHYHLIIYNCPLPIETFYDTKIDWAKNVKWKNTILERAWTRKGEKEPMGFIEVSEANWQTIAYVARYITKKINGPESEEHYLKKGQIKEFMRVSRNPGIANEYYQRHKEEIYEHDKVLIKDNTGLVWKQPPKYFDDLYEKENPERLAEIKEVRQKRMIDALMLKQERTSKTIWEQMQVERRSKEERTTALRRNSEL